MWQGDESYRVYATFWAPAIPTRYESIVAQKGILEALAKCHFRFEGE